MFRCGSSRTSWGNLLQKGPRESRNFYNKALAPIARWWRLAALALLVMALAACSRTYAPGSVELSPTPPVSTPVRSNSGGGVEVKIKPLAQPAPGMKELRFEVVMDTHSVNLDQYNLKDLAVLRFGTGPEVRAAAWAAVPGGHHVEGTLAFSDTQAIIPSDAAYLELVIRNLAGVAERVFRWELR